MKRLAAFLFLLSGACGLVYEVVWTRMMTHVFGSTALAVGTVLAAFMTGLALGSWLLGRFADRVNRPLRFYAGLEAGVALAAALAHVLLSNMAPAYLAVHAAFGGSDVALAVARFLMAFLLIVAPTILMGATLPVLARFVVRDLASLGAQLSTLYAINTIGAVGGALAAGFWLIGAYGVHGEIGRRHVRQQDMGDGCGHRDAGFEAGVEAQRPVHAVGEASQQPAAQCQAGHERRQHGADGQRGAAEDVGHHAGPRHFVDQAAGAREEEEEGGESFHGGSFRSLRAANRPRTLSHLYTGSAWR